MNVSILYEVSRFLDADRACASHWYEYHIKIEKCTKYTSWVHLDKTLESSKNKKNL